MATDTGVRLVGPVELTNAAATYYTAPGGTKATMLSIQVVANDGAAHTFTLSIGADAVGTRLFQDIPVTPGLPYSWNGFHIVDAAEIIQAFADSATGVTLTISGVETA